MSPDEHVNAEDETAIRERRFDDACESFAEFFLEAIESTFDDSNGVRLHPEEPTQGDLIAMMNRARTES